MTPCATIASPAFTDELAQRLPHGLVVEHRSRQPHGVRTGCVSYEGQTEERATAFRAVPSRLDGERFVDLLLRRELVQESFRRRRRFDRLDLGLEHRDCRSDCRSPVVTERLGEPFVQRAELEEVEELAHLLTVERFEPKSVRRDLERHVAKQHHHVGVATDPLFVLAEAGAQLRGLFVDVLEDAVDAAVRVDQLRRRLLTDARDTGEVVGRVAAQRGVLRVQLRRDAGALLDAGFVVERVVGHAASVVEDLDQRILDELVRVAVAGDDRAPRRLGRAPGSRAWR